MNVVPAVLLIVFIGFFYLDKLVLLLVFLTPLSIPLSKVIEGLPIDMYLPTEPILFGILIIFIAKIIHEKKFDTKILFHPVSIAIYFNLFWIFITAVTSTMFDVSIKFFVARLWFLVAFYFIASQIFVNIKQIKKYYWLYISSLLIVIFYAWIRLSEYGFLNQKAAHWSANPFFNDHTSYGSVLAMFLPFLIGFSFTPFYSKFKRRIIILISIIVFFAIIFSYTRATWVSLFPALGVWIAVKLKIKFRTIATIGLILIALFFIYQNQIYMAVEKNKQESSADIGDHVRSISNVRSDASNLERINRWNCAIRMFKQKPIFGWGPGTYMFNYAPFQVSNEKTIISTNTGKAGNAHSEYLGPLSESGILGTISFVLIVVFTIITALKVHKKANSEEVKALALFSLLGLITYYSHGLLNNFLDTDKASVPFWGFTAMIVALDVYHRNRKEG